ncbi:hypothetical protein JCM8547_001168 [Rhodosporidiobolus lusitaniae]
MRRDSLEDPLLPTEHAYPPRPTSRWSVLTASARARGPHLKYWLLGVTTSLALLWLVRPSETTAGNPGATWDLSRTNTAQNRLALLNEDYDASREGFGVGSVRLDRYRDELLNALDDVLGLEDLSESKAVDTLDAASLRYGANNSAIRSATRCFLDLRCTDHGPIPEELFATDRLVSPIPSLLQSWATLNPSYKLSFLDDQAVEEWVSSRFADSTLPDQFDALPLPILKYDLLRLLLTLTRGGIYTDSDTLDLRAISSWSDRAVDFSDALLAPLEAGKPRPPPSLIVGIEWTGHTETNKLNPLYTRSTGIVQWAFGAAQGHPVIVDSVRRVLRNSRKVEALREGRVDEDGAGGGGAGGGGGGGGPLHFDPDAPRMVLEWSGPALLTDAVARYLRTRHGVSLTSLSHYPHPVRIGDVLLLPLAALNARTSVFLKVLDWVLGRGWAPWRRENDLVLHAHSGSWWTQKLSAPAQ